MRRNGPMINNSRSLVEIYDAVTRLYAVHMNISNRHIT